jgi:hypothetical protein
MPRPTKTKVLVADVEQIIANKVLAAFVTNYSVHG